MAHSDEDSTPVDITLNASHTDRAVFCNQPVLSGLASNFANVHTPKSSKKKKNSNLKLMLRYDLSR